MRDVLFKGMPVPQPSCLIPTPRAALKFSSCAWGRHPSMVLPWAGQHVASAQSSSPREEAINPM